MGAQYVDPFGRARGTKQWIVRGQIFLGEQREGLLRPRIDEYPERWPINPMFPQPGNRAGSRAPVRQGGSAATGVAGGPGGEIPTELEVQPVVDIYPLPREREIELPVGQLPPPESSEASGISQCAGQGGTIIGGSSNVGAGTTVISVTPLINFPFIVTAAHFKTTLVALDQTVYFVVKVSDDQNTAAGENETGDRLFIKAGGAGRIRQFGEWLTMFPEERQDLPNKFAKFIFVNGSAAAVNFLCFLSIRRSD